MTFRSHSGLDRRSGQTHCVGNAPHAGCCGHPDPRPRRPRSRARGDCDSALSSAIARGWCATDGLRVDFLSTLSAACRGCHGAVQTRQACGELRLPYGSLPRLLRGCRVKSASRDHMQTSLSCAWLASRGALPEAASAEAGRSRDRNDTQPTRYDEASPRRGDTPITSPSEDYMIST